MVFHARAAGVPLLARDTRLAASPPSARVRVRLSGADALRYATASSDARARLSDSVVHSGSSDWAPLRRRRRGLWLPQAGRARSGAGGSE